MNTAKEEKTPMQVFDDLIAHENEIIKDSNFKIKQYNVAREALSSVRKPRKKRTVARVNQNPLNETIKSQAAQHEDVDA